MAFDPDFGKAGYARHLFRLRFRHLNLTQRAFAERFGLSYSLVRDAEQGAAPTRALRLIVAARHLWRQLRGWPMPLAPVPRAMPTSAALPVGGNYHTPTRARDVVGMTSHGEA